MSTTAKNILKNGLVLLAALVLCFLLLEVVLRVALPQNLTFTQFNPILGQELIPNKEVLYANPQTIFSHEYIHPVRINSQSIREDKEYSYDHPDTFRIIVLGSSFSLGLGVPVEDTFEKMFITKAKDFQPDAVLMNIPTIYGVRPPNLFQENEGSLEFRPRPSPLFQLQVRQFLSKHLHSWNFIIKLLNSNVLTNAALTKAGLFASGDKTLFGLSSQEEYERGLRLQTEIVQKAHQYAQQNNITFLVGIVPTKVEIDSRKFREAIHVTPLEPFLERNQIEHDLVQELTQQSIPVVQYSKELKSQNLNNTFYYEIDGHWNKEGHKLVADILFQELQQKGITNVKQ